MILILKTFVRTTPKIPPTEILSFLVIAGGVPKYVPLRPNYKSENRSSADWLLDPKVKFSENSSSKTTEISSKNHFLIFFSKPNFS